MTHPASEPNSPVGGTGNVHSTTGITGVAASQADATNALEPILATAGVSKTFPGVKALQRVDFRLFPGEIHTLMGQNGAGKSTLINVLTGVLAPDEGTIRLGGELRQSPGRCCDGVFVDADEAAAGGLG